MSKKRSNILILFFILFGSSGIGFLLNNVIESLQKKYKEATGKNAIWRGAETKAYKDWKTNQ